jgi:hypothetical protein
MPLNDRGTSYLNQWKQLGLLMADNPDAVDLIGVFGTRYLMWVESMEDVDDYMNKVNASTAGITDDKNQAKSDSATSGSTMGGMGVSYAITTKDIELQTLMMTYTYNKLYEKTNDPDLRGVITNIYKRLFAITEVDPIVSANYFPVDKLDAMLVDAGLFASKTPNYKLALHAINGSKRNFYDLQIPIMEEHILFFEAFLSTIAISFPDFVKGFRKILEKLDEVGQRNQGSEAEMYDATTDEPIGLGGLMMVTNYIKVKKAKIEKTNSMGVFPIMHLRVGIWKLKFSFPGYVTQYVTIIVKARGVVRLKIMMVKVEERG